jgi:hypothetical protein
MRYFALILSAGVALAAHPAAAAVSTDTPRDAIAVANGCPVYEGYPDCHPDSEPAWTPYTGRLLSAPTRDARQRRTGALRVAHEVSSLRRR